MAKIVYDPNYMEPKPKRHHGIFCFTCDRRVLSKVFLMPEHENHDVDYLDANGNRAT